jgi:hypothetical protein
VHAIGGKQDQDDEVGDEQRQVEGVGLVNAPERLIEEMGTEILPEAARAGKKGEAVEDRNQVSTPRRRAGKRANFDCN